MADGEPQQLAQEVTASQQVLMADGKAKMHSSTGDALCRGASTAAISIGSSSSFALGESSPEGELGLRMPAPAGARLRAGGIVVRWDLQATQPEVLLVSRRKVPDMYTVPAGKFEEDVDDGSFEACALRETREEAGIECSIVLDLGWYKAIAKDQTETRTRFFAMKCVRELPSWCEETERRRCWHLLEEAQRLTQWNPMLSQVLRQLDVSLTDKHPWVSKSDRPVVNDSIGNTNGGS